MNFSPWPFGGFIPSKMIVFASANLSPYPFGGFLPSEMILASLPRI
jgi:hypothetical protein